MRKPVVFGKKNMKEIIKIIQSIFLNIIIFKNE